MIIAKVKIEEFLIEQNDTIARVRRMVSDPIMPGYSVRWDYQRNGEWRRMPNPKELEVDYYNFINKDLVNENNDDNREAIVVNKPNEESEVVIVNKPKRKYDMTNRRQ